ncbi:hypothetical protein CBS101457_003338 [Exobasidium rhododendri]|nr:hypothetical protein CBS101457_003338 [Exobasidium rhododendri]
MCDRVDERDSQESAGNTHDNEVDQNGDNSRINLTVTQARNFEADGGAWQGGNYLDYLLDDTCDSSIQAWSEDGHKDYIGNRKKAQRKESQKRKRQSTTVVHGTLIPQNTKLDHVTMIAGREKNVKSFLGPALSAQSPGQISDAYSSPFTSPLEAFPCAPERASSGKLISKSTSIYSPVTPKGFLQHPHRPPQHDRLVIKNYAPLGRQLSQSKVDHSPLDGQAVLTSGWTVEPLAKDRGEEQNDAWPSISPSVMIDNLMQGVQEGMFANRIVVSPDNVTTPSSAHSGWETDDCEMTPRLRAKWEETSPATPQMPKRPDQDCRIQVNRSDSRRSLNSTTPNGRQLSFIRVPSAIFPHTPAALKQQQRHSVLSAKRASISSISSTSSRTSKKSKTDRDSLRSSCSTSRRAGRRRSAHVVPTPRPLARKSRYYSKPPQPGVMPSVIQQHLQGARGKYWSPMNSFQAPKIAAVAGVRCNVNKSSRYSRRSGQDWIRPRNFEGGDHFRVTVYPPQVDSFHSEKDTVDAAEGKDIDKTPTQADFNRKATPTPRPTSRCSKSSSSRGPAPRPPPSTSLPPVPLLSYTQKNKKSFRSSKSIRLQVSESENTCSTCRSHPCACLQSSAGRSASSSCCRSYSDVETCSCADYETCTCTRSSQYGTEVEYVCPSESLSHRPDASNGKSKKASQVPGLPRSAPLVISVPREITQSQATPRSAPHYSSQHPPVLDPIPRLSPFHVNFDHIFGYGRRSSKAYKNSVYARTSTGFYTETSYSECPTCCNQTDCQSCTTQSQRGGCSSTESASYDFTIESSSPSCSSSSSALGNDEDSYDSDSGRESDDMPLTPPRSEYQSSLGYLESPGYRVSCIVSPMPRSGRRESQMQDLLDRESPTSQVFEYQRSVKGRSEGDGSISQMKHCTFTTSSSSNLTFSPNGTHYQPRSILKVSTCSQKCSSTTTTTIHSSQAAGLQRRPTISMAANTISNSQSAFSSKASSASQRATLATSTLTKYDLEGRIQREEQRRRRNESRLLALEKLEGKTKKSSLFYSLLSNSTNSSSGFVASSAGARKNKDRRGEDEEEEEEASVPQTPLTPSKEHLKELQIELENRQKITQFQNNKAVSFTDVIGFDLGTYPKICSRKSRTGSDSEGSSAEKDDIFKNQIKKLSTAIEARQRAKDKCLDN